VYSIKDAYIYHHYDRDLKRIWDDKKEKEWMNMNRDSINTTYKILSLNEDGIYGIGNIEEYVEYQQRTETDMLGEAGRKWRP
jgi:Lhr-like helicase